MCKYCDSYNLKIGQARKLASCGKGGTAEWLIRKNHNDDKVIIASIYNKDYTHYARLEIPANYCPHCGKKL